MSEINLSKFCFLSSFAIYTYASFLTISINLESYYDINKSILVTLIALILMLNFTGYFLQHGIQKSSVVQLVIFITIVLYQLIVYDLHSFYDGTSAQWEYYVQYIFAISCIYSASINSWRTNYFRLFALFLVIVEVYHLREILSNMDVYAFNTGSLRVLSIFSLLIVLIFYEYSNSLLRKLWVVLSIPLVLLIYLFQQRGATFFLVFMMAGLAINKFVKKGKLRKRLFFIFIICVMIFQIVFPFFYIYLFDAGFDPDAYTKDITGKALFTNRQSIWGEFMGDISRDKFYLYLGYGRDIDNSTVNYANNHNNFIAQIMHGGIIGLMLYIIFLISMAGKLIFSKNKQQVVTGVVFLSMLITQTTEASLMDVRYVCLFSFVLAFGYSLDNKTQEIGKDEDINAL